MRNCGDHHEDPCPRRALRPEPASRASQFMPFAALKGYDELVRTRDRTPEPVRELAEDEELELSRRMAQVRRGCVVRVCHRDGDTPQEREGPVTALDPIGRTISVGGRRIPFEAITAISLAGDAEWED